MPVPAPLPLPLPRAVGTPRPTGATGALLAAVLLAAAPGCAGPADGTPPAPASPPPGSPPPAATAPPPPPTVEALVDSALGAFRAGVPDPGRLSGGEPTRDALAAAFVRALAGRDTAALRGLHLTRAEFAWLYFPTARLARPPYGIDPGFLWAQISSAADRDLGRAFAAVRAGTRYAGHVCTEPAVVEGANRIHERCTVILRDGARTDTLALFGSVLERDGRFKLVSFANPL